MVKIEFVIPKIHCVQCGHEWTPRTDDIKKCPKCNSYFWNEEPQEDDTKLTKRNRWMKLKKLGLTNGLDYHKLTMVEMDVILNSQSDNVLIENESAIDIDEKDTTKSTQKPKKVTMRNMDKE